MFWPLVTSAARPFLRGWMSASARSQLRSPYATGAPQVHAEGADADRILLVGDGPSVGHGVLTHELGLAGHLARRLSPTTGRGTDIDIIVSGSMTAANCLAAMGETDLSRFDAVLVTVGANEARGLHAVALWRRDLEDLLDRLEEMSPSSVHIFVIAIPTTRASIDFPAIFRTVVDRQVGILNRESESLCGGRERVTLVPFDPPGEREAHRHTSSEYERWAGMIAPHVSPHLDEASLRPRALEEQDEPARQQSLDELGLTAEPDQRIDTIVASARDLLGAGGAAVTLIDGETQWIKSTIGIESFEVLRTNAFCDVTIRRAEVLIIEDALLDARFRETSSVREDGIRFYAGYPIETPNGRRVGALCVIDTVPRKFTPADASLLRDLAIQVQNEIWESVPGSSSQQNPASRAAGSRASRDRTTP